MLYYYINKMAELSSQESELIKSVMQNHGTKLNDRMESLLMNLLNGSVEKGLDGIVSFFTRGQQGLQREGLNKLQSPGIYTGNTTYRLLLKYIQQVEFDYFDGHMISHIVL